jgi:regulator of protease activity HflC (stomatin/prohibitin superfamily)
MKDGTLYGIVAHIINSRCGQIPQCICIKVQGRFALSKKRSQSTVKKELGVILLLLAMVILGAVGYFLNDATGYPYNTFGFFWWSLAVFMWFTVGMLYYALFVLPIAGNEGWAEGLRLLTRNFVSPPPRVDSANKKRRPRVTAVMPEHLADLPPSFAFLDSGMIPSHQVLAVVKSGSFSRAAGPGFVILFKKEKISQIVDVRKHIRAEPTKANTRDGIPVDINTSVVFRVWQEDEDIMPGNLVYHVDPDAIFHVNYAGSVVEGESYNTWSDIVAPLAASLFVAEISRYTLDELYQVDREGNGPRKDIGQNVKRALGQNERLDGVEILNASFAVVEVPGEIVAQRMKQWQAHWQRQITITKAKGAAEANLRLKHARARAQVQIIQNITQSITDSSRSGISVTEIVAMRMIEALEDAVADVSMLGLVPKPVLASMVESSRQMLSYLDDEGTAQDVS